MVAFESKVKKLLEEQGKTLVALCKHIDVSDPGIRKMFKRGSCEVTTLEKIADFFSVSPTYFFDEKSANGIPMLDGEQVRAGSLVGVGEPLKYIDIIRLPELRWRDGDFAVRANGRSMIDPVRPDQSIPDGATVILRPWTESYIQWGHTYCIATANGYAIKRLQPGTDEDHIKCVSNNEGEGFAPYQIARSDIHGIAIVTAIINLTTLY